MSLVRINCANCGCEASQESGSVNRARRKGASLYCGRACAGVGRRSDKSLEQRKAEKHDYDANRRVVLKDRLKSDKAAYFQRTYDPAAAAVKRKALMPYHVKYCQSPEYREWKREYDRRYCARKYGPFGDAYLLLLDIDKEVNDRMSDYDVRIANGTLNKRQQRKRDYVSAFGG